MKSSLFCLANYQKYSALVWFWKFTILRMDQILVTSFIFANRLTLPTSLWYTLHTISHRIASPVFQPVSSLHAPIATRLQLSAHNHVFSSSLSAPLHVRSICCFLLGLFSDKKRRSEAACSSAVCFLPISSSDSDASESSFKMTDAIPRLPMGLAHVRWTTESSFFQFGN